jgi:DNA-binding CsgD family transcriptional regulator
MNTEGNFSTISGKLFDSWLLSSADVPAAPFDIYRRILDELTVKMRLSVIDTTEADPYDWQMSAIRQSGFPSRLIDVNAVFSDCQLRDFRDQAYLEASVLPRYREVLDSQRPKIETVRATLLGLHVCYDWILLPQKSKTRPDWIVSVSSTRFLMKVPAGAAGELDLDDQIVIQMLAEGASAREIAESLSISNRTIEHRIERMKSRLGARNVVNLVAIAFAAHVQQASGESTRQR